MEQKDNQLNYFYCLSLVYNPLMDKVPEIFCLENKNKKESFTHDILRNKFSYSFTNIILLKTCQRIELYIISDRNPEELRGKFLDIYRNYFSDNFYEKLKLYSSEKGLVHLVQLASGLESFIIGENEIYDQIKNLSEKYHEDGLAGDFMNKTFIQALETARDTRRIIIDENKIKSYPEISLEFTKSKGITPSKILVLGEGLLSKSVGEFWIKNGAEVKIVNNKEPINFSNFDVIINCDSKTSTKLLDTIGNVMFIDFSVPPLLGASLEYTHYFSIKDFKDIIEKNNQFLNPSVEKARHHVNNEMKVLINSINKE
jgi:glutamyl-tRNA reductase